jgi:hypothetical protein
MRAKGTNCIVFVVLGIAACSQEPESLDNGVGHGGRPQLEFCESFYWSDEGGSAEMPLTKVWDGKCARGAVCGAGVSYFICPPAESPEWSVLPRLTEIRERHPTYPFCDGSGEDGCYVCFLEPGCPSQGGRCVHGLTLLPDPVLECQRQQQGCSTYCGCDGETYEGLPTRPFRHPGPCAPSS